MAGMSKEIAWGDGWKANSEGAPRESNPHPECEGKSDKLNAVRFSRSMRRCWFAGWDDHEAGHPNDWTERLKRDAQAGVTL